MRAKHKASRWALLAYTVADDTSGGNDLDASVKDELQAICSAADLLDLNLALQVDFKRTHGVFCASLTERGPARAASAATRTPMPARPRARGFVDVAVAAHPLWRTLLSGVSRATPRLQMGKVDGNAARASVLDRFLSFGHRVCRGHRLVLFFYGHAAGPMGLFFDKDPNASASETTTIRLGALAQSLSTIAPSAPVVVFRDCFMNTLETAYELRESNEFMVASQSEMPIAGIWPWLPLMTTMLPSASAREVGRAIAIQLGGFMDAAANRGSLGAAPVSLIDLAASHRVAAPLKALTTALLAARRSAAQREACMVAIEGARTGYSDDPAQPGDPALVDVLTMCDRLGALGFGPITKATDALARVVREHLVGWHHSQTKRFTGVSLYYKPINPRDLDRSIIQAWMDERHYRKLGLVAATNWADVALHPLGSQGRGRLSV
jgi:hypothetical protein